MKASIICIESNAVGKSLAEKLDRDGKPGGILLLSKDEMFILREGMVVLELDFPESKVSGFADMVKGGKRVEKPVEIFESE